MVKTIAILLSNYPLKNKKMINNKRTKALLYAKKKDFSTQYLVKRRGNESPQLSADLGENERVCSRSGGMEG